jgi:hypothetical protein
MSYSIEFPEYSAADMPTILLGKDWQDYSWHNDACPFFVHVKSGIGVWCDHVDSAMRDCPSNSRFCVVQLEREGKDWTHPIDSAVELFQCDDIALLERYLTRFTDAGLRALVARYLTDSAALDLDPANPIKTQTANITGHAVKIALRRLGLTMRDIGL